VGLGGLGHLALHFSHALGLETLAITEQASKKEVRRKMGADDVPVAGAQLRRGRRRDPLHHQREQAGRERLHRAEARGQLVNMGVTDGLVAVDPMTLMTGQRQLGGSSQDERSDLIEAPSSSSRWGR